MSAPKDSIGSPASTSSFTSPRWVIWAVPASEALTASAELRNRMNSQACLGNREFGLTTRTPPPDMLTKSCPPTPAPGRWAGIRAQPTAASRSAIFATPFLGSTTERQK